MATTCTPWDITWQCDIDCLSPDVTGSAVAVAQEILYAMTGQQFGLCTQTFRPCRKSCADGWWMGWGDLMYPLPALIGGKWFNLICGQCGDNCSCSALSEVELGDRVSSITQVKVDGSPLVTGAYRVDNGHLLVRTDGGRWPFCNDLTKPDTAVGTWSITAVYGQAVPQLGRLAMGELACELSKSFAGEQCRLPRAVQSVARQGVTINYGDVTDLMNQGLTGLYLVDQFIQAYNPNRLTARGRVYNVDAPVFRTQTWP